VVVDGSVVDTTSILSHAVPVFARGATFAHGDNRTPGSVNIPIVCGGVLIQPGDIVLGELDGIIVVPRVDAEAVLVAAEEKTARLRTIAARLRETGETLLDVNGGRGMISDAGVQWVD
jgi:4-hydroxy-4-methyl-2-oxoglutarate aldolase